MHFFRISFFLCTILSLLLLISCQKEPRQINNTPTTWSIQTWNGVAEFKSTEFKDSLTLISFWATWCTSCQLEIPILRDLNQELKPKGLRIISVNLDQNPSQVLPNYLKRNPYPFNIYLPNSNLEQAFGVPSMMPTLYLIDQNGQLIQKWTGPQTLHQLRSEISPLL